MKRKVSVSFLSSKNVIDDLLDLEATDTDFIHVDEMDGKFVKNKNTQFKILDRMSYVLQKRLDVHLMVKNPSKLIEKYITLNTEYITLHVELGNKILDYYNQIKSYGIKCGLAINPDTDIESIKDYLDYIDLILVIEDFHSWINSLIESFATIAGPISVYGSFTSISWTNWLIVIIPMF